MTLLEPIFARRRLQSLADEDRTLRRSDKRPDSSAPSERWRAKKWPSVDDHGDASPRRPMIAWNSQWTRRAIAGILVAKIWQTI